MALHFSEDEKINFLKKEGYQIPEKIHVSGTDKCWYDDDTKKQIDEKFYQILSQKLLLL
jgi:hypothetical protein